MNNDINYSIPAELINFRENSEGNIEATLKVCYIGETVDGRVFDEDFVMGSLFKSLPHTPVVGAFDFESEEFKGHSEEQDVLGIVRGDTQPRVEVFEDKRWLVGDVILFASRPGLIGDLAKRIVGQPQSLELSRENTRYETFKQNGKRKYRFLESSLIGLSVLGTNETPAFTGSTFFKSNEEIEVRFNNFMEFLKNNNRGETMENQNKTYFSALEEFAQKTYSQIQTDLSKTISEMDNESVGHFMVDNNDTVVIYQTFDYNTWDTKFFRSTYSVEEGKYTLGDAVEVIRTFVTAEELEGLNFKEEDKKEEKEEKCEKCGKTPCECEDKKDEEDDKDFASTEETNTVETESTEVATTTEEFTTQETQSEATNEETKETSESTTSLSDSERNELEAFRHKEKLAIIATYEGELAEETLTAYAEKVDTFSKDDLEAKLAIEFRNFSIQNKKENNKEQANVDINVFSTFAPVDETQPEPEVELNPVLAAIAMFK